jgi:biopolymer transport protein TolR
MVSAASRFEDEESGSMITDINVTPLVDITLVLLIIFMVTTTYIVNPTIKVELPRAATGTEQTRTTLGLTLTKQGVLYLNGEPSDDVALRKYIRSELPKNPDLQAIIAADKVVPHGNVVRLIDLVKQEGVRKFAINVDALPAGAIPPALPVPGAAPAPIP